MKRLITSVVLVAFLGTGCATLFAGKKDAVNFNSDPGGAEIFVNGNRMGVSPVTLELSNNQNYAVTFKKDGYRDVTCNLNKKVGAGWVVLDVLGGLVPVIIDAATGSWNQLDSKVCSVNLPKS